jgi:16S rRNA processing protein RimM
VTGWVRLGVIGRPHGVRGALRVHLDNPDSTALRPGRLVRLVGSTATTEVVVRSYGHGVLHLADVTDREAALRFVHAVVEIARDALGDDVLLIDLIGHAVVDERGAPLGRIVRFSDNGAHPLAEVATPDGRTVLVPFVAPLVVSLGSPVVLAPPIGLFDDEQALVAGTADDFDREHADVETDLRSGHLGEARAGTGGDAAADAAAEADE